MPRINKHVSSCWGVLEDKVIKSSFENSFTDPSRRTSLHEIATAGITVNKYDYEWFIQRNTNNLQNQTLHQQSSHYCIPL